jgi:uncharacterized integral membrane protein
MESWKLIAALLLAFVLVAFGAQNTQAVTFHFLIFSAPSVPMVVALFAAALVGAVLVWAVSAPGHFRRMRDRQGLKGRVAAHDRELSAGADRSDLQ